MGEITSLSDQLAATRTFRWIQPSWKRRIYELRDGDDAVIATFEYRGMWRTRATLCFEGEELEFQGRGFLKSNTAIVRGAQDIALYKPKSFSGEITFMTGRKFWWRRKGLFKSSCMFTTADNEDLMTFKNTPRFFRSESSLTVSPSAEQYPETRILMALGWYLMLASAQAATAAAS